MKNFFNVAKFFVYGIVWLFIFIIFIYFHPTNEYMVCDATYSCKITHEYFHKFNFYENINVSKESVLSYKVYKPNIFLRSRRHGFSDYVYLKYDNISPFIFYSIMAIGSEDEIQKEINNFNQYKLKPQLNYFVKSEADSSHFYIWFVGFIVFFLLFLYTYFFEDYNHKDMQNK